MTISQPLVRNRGERESSCVKSTVVARQFGYPMPVVYAWTGNSQAIAKEHDLQVIDDHFEKAAQSGAKTGAADQGTVENTANPCPGGWSESRSIRHYATLFRYSVGATGFEPVTSAV